MSVAICLDRACRDSEKRGILKEIQRNEEERQAMKKCIAMKPLSSIAQWMKVGALSGLCVVGGYGEGFGANLDKQGTQWAPFMEWSLPNPTYSGNPYDLIATATFVHNGSGETHTTEMFYDGGDTWKFRFTGTRLGTWAVSTSSADSDLDGHQGTVTVTANSNPDIMGFVTNEDEKWVRQMGDNGDQVKAFVPQLVMINGPQGYYNDPSEVDNEINRFFGDHGFNGFHILVTCRWFQMNKQKCNQVNNGDPDPNTFEALELVITKAHGAGGIVHIWMWGDESRGWTPKNFGYNDTEDQRLHRYIAARLGPLPGWTMGYGFDLWEWTTKNQLQTWHNYMRQHLGWPHLLGARANKNQLNQIYEGLDYSGYEQWRPDYDKYVETIERRPQKPSFSEDRFRIRNNYPNKDYDEEMTRRGLWHSTMAGGVANIWGDLTGHIGANDGTDTSRSYTNAYQLKTNAEFFKDRFHKDLERCNSLTDGYCLQMPDNTRFMFYKESTSSIQMDLSGMVGPQPAVAVDAKKAYAEIDLGMLSATNQTWNAPYSSDWAIAVGNSGTPPDSTPPATPTGLGFTTN